MGKLVYLKNVVTLELNEQKCTGCGMCLEVCPHDVFEINEAKARIRDRDACMECGACQRNCTADAIVVEAGVGCAGAVMAMMLGQGKSACCGPENGEKGCCS